MKKTLFIFTSVILVLTVCSCSSRLKTDTVKTDTVKTGTVKTGTVKTGTVKTDTVKTDTETENAFAEIVKNNITDGEGYIPEDAPFFLSEENKELFRNADYIYFNFSVCGGFDLIDYENENFVDIDKNGTTYRYYQTGYDYSDFVDYIKSIFTDEKADSLINSSDFYINIDGKLYCMDGARGSNISYTGKKFDLISENKDEIVFKATAGYSWAEFYENEQQYRDEGNTGDFEWQEEFTYKLVKSDEGFRIENFEYWK